METATEKAWSAIKAVIEKETSDLSDAEFSELCEQAADMILRLRLARIQGLPERGTKN